MLNSNFFMRYCFVGLIGFVMCMLGRRRNLRSAMFITSLVYFLANWQGHAYKLLLAYIPLDAAPVSLIVGGIFAFAHVFLMRYWMYIASFMVLEEVSNLLPVNFHLRQQTYACRLVIKAALFAAFMPLINRDLARLEDDGVVNFGNHIKVVFQTPATVQVIK